MANILSEILSDVSSGVIISAGVQKGNVLSASAMVDIVTEPDLGDVLFYLDLPSNCILHSLVFRNTQMDNVGNPNATQNNALVIGIYAASTIRLRDGTKFNEGDEISPNFFGTSETMFDTNTETDGLEVRFSMRGANTNSGIRHAQDDLWELAGLSSDPSSTLRIGCKISRVFSDFTPGISICQAIFTGKN